MNATEATSLPRLGPAELAELLEVTRKLAAPFELSTMLSTVVDAGRRVLRADRGSVFLFDEAKHELALTVATQLEPIRMPADRGIVGECVRTRAIINVPDCYADPRFNQELDRRTGYRTRCLLTLPLIDHDGRLIGVLQLLNKDGGVFDEHDERVAAALAAQCAVALHRVQMMETRLLTEKLDREISVAREIQMSALPKQMPPIAGYEGAGIFRPTDQTGGDLFDFVRIADDQLILLMGDATGHGIGPALSATQVRAMVRVALRLGASLDDLYRQVNNQLVEDLPEDRFVTAFLGVLDAASHCVKYHSGGQGPLLHFRVATQEFEWHGPTTFPMGAWPQQDLDAAQSIELEPGDILGLISDGIYEYVNPDGALFGQERVAETIRQHQDKPMTELAELLLVAAREFGGTAPQADDVTILLLRRLPQAG